MKRRVTGTMNFQEAISAAWDLIWAEKLAARAAGDDGFRGEHYHASASDVEDVVRQFARDALDGKPRRTKTNRGDHHGVKIRGDLNGAVRSWLQNNPKIAKHNFGRGHISGMRFRPVGQPMTPAETKTIERNAEMRRNPKPRPCHYSESGHGTALCVLERFKKQGRRLWGFRPSKAWTTRKVENVTCQQCINLLTDLLTESVLAPSPMTKEKMMEIARGGIESHLGDVAAEYDSAEAAADAIYDEAYTLAFDALADAGVDHATAGTVAKEIAMCYAQP